MMIIYRGEDVREGMTAVISIKHPEPQFEGQTKTKLGNSEVRGVTDRLFSEALSKFLLENPTTAKQVVEKGVLASKARMAAKRAREMTRRKGHLKLVACRVNWRIVLVEIQKNASYTLSRGFCRRFG